MTHLSSVKPGVPVSSEDLFGPYQEDDKEWSVLMQWWLCLTQFPHGLAYAPKCSKKERKMLPQRILCRILCWILELEVDLKHVETTSHIMDRNLCPRGGRVSQVTQEGAGPTWERGLPTCRRLIQRLLMDSEVTSKSFPYITFLLLVRG